MFPEEMFDKNFPGVGVLHILIIQTILSAVFITSKSIIFNPPLFFSPTIVILLILRGFTLLNEIKDHAVNRVRQVFG